MMRIVAQALLVGTIGVSAASAQPTPPSGAGAPTPAARNAQQDLLKSCNQQVSARKLAANERSGFLNNCLAGKGPTFATAQSTPHDPNKPAPAR